MWTHYVYLDDQPTIRNGVLWVNSDNQRFDSRGFGIQDSELTGNRLVMPVDQIIMAHLVEESTFPNSLPDRLRWPCVTLETVKNYAAIWFISTADAETDDVFERAESFFCKIANAMSSVRDRYKEEQ